MWNNSYRNAIAIILCRTSAYQQHLFSNVSFVWISTHRVMYGVVLCSKHPRTQWHFYLSTKPDVPESIYPFQPRLSIHCVTFHGCTPSQSHLSGAAPFPMAPFSIFFLLHDSLGAHQIPLYASSVADTHSHTWIAGQEFFRSSMAKWKTIFGARRKTQWN